MTITFDATAASSTAAILVLAAAAVIFGVTITIRIRRFLASKRFEAADRDTMRRRWVEIEDLMRQPGEMPPRMAVLEADKLLDYALKSLAMPGETLGERLKFAQYRYPQLKEVWWAHKIRNRLAHESTFRLERRLARRALRTFRKALETLGAI
ncbi:hypothetical protein AMJ57_02830 [Parcubacteria bacterium SG8_24]|nr:MAG: hypothetical protein AMJ57_02830 [Parcubacteria bacterium SG8_24]